MAYEGSVELISGIKTKNNGTFPLVDAPDIRVTDDLRLPGALDLKANLASPTFTGTPKSVTPSSSSNAKMIATKEYVDNAFTVNDAMLFKGTIGTVADGGTIQELPAIHKQGWTYKVVTSDTYAGKVCEVGDMIICVKDGTGTLPFNNADWTVVQTNINGAVTGPASSTDGNVALFNGLSGKVIKDGGTIQSLIIKDNASGVEASSKVWSAQKSIDELAQKTDDADIFKGISIYDPDSASQGSFTFAAGTYAHQAGTAYIVYNKSGLDMAIVPPSNLPTSSDQDYTVYTLKDYIDTKVPKTTKVNGHALSSDVTVTKSDVGLGNVDNTADADKPVSTAQQAALDLKAPKSHPKFSGTVEVDNNENLSNVKTPEWNSSTTYEVNNLVYDNYIHPELGSIEGWYVCLVSNANKRPWNYPDYWKAVSYKYIEIVGNGFDSNDPSNARVLDWVGNEYLQGDLYINCNADSTGGTKVGDALDLKANYTDVFVGCTEYAPVHRASFHTNTWYHEQGTAYICRLKSDDPDLVLVRVGPTHSVPGGETVELPYNLPTVEDSTFYVYSLVNYIDSKAPKENPVFTGTLTLGTTTLTEAKLQELINLTSATGVSF